MDKEHFFVHMDKVKDGCGIGATALLVTDVIDYLEEPNSILGGACFCPRVYREQFGLHLGRGVLHHEVVDLLGILISPFFLIVGMVIFPLPFCHLDKVGRICRVVREGNDWLLELGNGQSSEQTVKLQAAPNVLVDDFDVEIKRGRGHGIPSVVQYDVLEALRRCREHCFLGGEGLVVKTRGSFDLDFLFSIRQLGSCHLIFDGCLLEESKLMDEPFNEDVRAKGISLISLMRIKIVNTIRCCSYRS